MLTQTANLQSYSYPKKLLYTYGVYIQKKNNQVPTFDGLRWDSKECKYVPLKMR